MVWEWYKPNISNDKELLDLVCKVMHMKSTANAPSIMILGPPGIGKSERLLEAVKTCLKTISNESEILIYEDISEMLYREELSEIVNKAKNGAVVVRMSAPYVLPQDFSWYPDKSNIKTYVELPPLWFLMLNEAKYGALIIEDITEVNDRYTMLLLQRLAFEKLLKMYKINKPIFMTGNPYEFSANEDLSISITTASGRFLPQTLSIPTLESWRVYMDKEYGSWDTDVYKFLNLTSEFGAKGAVDRCVREQRYAYATNFIQKLHSILKFMLLYDEPFIMRPEYLKQVKRVNIEVDGGVTVHTPRTWSAFASVNIGGDPRSYFRRITDTFNKYLAAMLTGFKGIRLESKRSRKLMLTGLKLLFMLLDTLKSTKINELEKNALRHVGIEGPFRTINALYETLFNNAVKPFEIINSKISDIINSMVKALDESFEKEEEMVKMGIAWGMLVGLLSLMLEGDLEKIVKDLQSSSSLNIHEKQTLNTLEEYVNIVRECSESGDA